MWLKAMCYFSRMHGYWVIYKSHLSILRLCHLFDLKLTVIHKHFTTYPYSNSCDYKIVISLDEKILANIFFEVV